MALARELMLYIPEDDDIGELVGTMRGDDAIAIIRMWGVKPGLLGFVA